MSRPERDRPDFDPYFMGLAMAVRARANCLGSRVGAVIVKDWRVLSTGYNGTPSKMKNCLDGGCERCAHPERYEILGWDMVPGDGLVFQAMIVHGSAGNLSATTRRRAWATRWTGDDARFCVRKGEVGYPLEDPGLRHGDLRSR